MDTLVYSHQLVRLPYQWVSPFCYCVHRFAGKHRRVSSREFFTLAIMVAKRKAPPGLPGLPPAKVKKRTVSLKGTVVAVCYSALFY